MKETPDQSILFLFKGELSLEKLNEIECDKYEIGGSDKEEVYWLNTPGPIYTTQTDNCGTGQPEAPKNVGGDYNYYEFVFKQPYNKTELIQIKNASDVDPFAGYYFDGNKYWTNDKIVKWWKNVENVFTYMIDRYDEELKLPSNPHKSLWDFGDGIKETQLFGPLKPMPENYKSALDFYQLDLKNYLEWYMEINNGLSIKLDDNDFNWERKIQLDKELEKFNPQKRDLIKEYQEEQSSVDKIETQTRETKIKQSYWDKLKKWLK